MSTGGLDHVIVVILSILPLNRSVRYQLGLFDNLSSSLIPLGYYTLQLITKHFRYLFPSIIWGHSICNNSILTLSYQRRCQLNCRICREVPHSPKLIWLWLKQGQIYQVPVKIPYRSLSPRRTLLSSL